MEYGDNSSAFATVNPFGGVDYAAMNKGITPYFIVKTQIHPAESEKQGRTVYYDEERVILFVAGDSLTGASHLVDDAIKTRFADAYADWKKKESGVHIKGMPLTRWPLASGIMIKELEFLHIFSVEDLASVSDSNIQNIPDGRVWRQKAEAWLKAANDGAAITRYAAENERLRDDLAEMTKRLDALEGAVGNVPASSVRRKQAKKMPPWTPERRAAMSAMMRERHTQHVENNAPMDVEG